MFHSLILGGAGFLGSHLTDQLLKLGHYVSVIDDLSTGDFHNLSQAKASPNFSYLERDICTGLDDLPRMDYVFNFASIASPPLYSMNQIHTLTTGSVGTLNALNFAAKHNARLIHASTSEVYGDPNIHPQIETYWGNVNPIGPRSCYDEAKRFGEAACIAFARERSASVGIVRIFNTYGPRLNPRDGRVVSNLINQALNDNPLTIYGDGQQTRSFCFVDDLIDGIIKFAFTTHTGPINLGNPYEVSILDLSTKILELTGSKSELLKLPLPVDDPVRRCPDITRARELLSWFPKTSLNDGLVETISYYRRLKSRVI